MGGGSGGEIYAMLDDDNRSGYAILPSWRFRSVSIEMDGNIIWLADLCNVAFKIKYPL